MESQKLSASITELDNDDRLDQWLAKVWPQFSRTYLKKIFGQGCIVGEREGKSIKLELKKMPEVGTLISLNPPEVKLTESRPQDIPLNILYEDEHLLFVNKPAGLVVHPGAGNPDGTLVNALLHHCPDIERVGDKIRPGIVHRLDKGTSGVMTVAKNDKTHRALVEIFSKHDIDREYQAIAVSKTFVTQAGHYEASIGRDPQHRVKMKANVSKGKWAKTYFKVESSKGPLHHLTLTLETGRTHQIRVHLSQVANAPILNDPLYGKGGRPYSELSPQLAEVVGGHPYPFLHAKRLGYIHPITGEKLDFQVAPPAPFITILDELWPS